MRRVAILKPDDLGDLVLAMPAIRRLASAYPECTLFCSPYTRGLAAFLFPGLRLAEISFPHLLKTGQHPPVPGFPGDYDLVVCLRADAHMEPWLRSRVKVPYLLAAEDPQTHETAMQRRIVEKVAGHYSRSAGFGLGRKPAYDPNPARVGLSVAAGFSANKWPAELWMRLARMLEKSGREVFLVGGPRELGEIRLLGALLRLPQARHIVGGADFAAFQAGVAALDLVIATDSGSAHLCSLSAPVLSIFGPSPYRRFAPFGAHNRVLTRDLSCSPCTQFDRSLLNLCVSRECINTIPPAAVLEAISLSSGEPGVQALGYGNLKVVRGASHLHRGNAMVREAARG
ncbi:MAG: glycosyltransferase family 9 protein [Burkholderiales bacterium]